MNSFEVLNYCLENFEGTILVESWGEKCIVYNPNKIIPHPVYAWMGWIAVLNPTQKHLKR